MNRLQLAQRVALECGITGAPGSELATTVGQTGDYGRVVSWVDQAYADIQTARPDWIFLRKTQEFTTAQNVNSYAPADVVYDEDFGTWRHNSFRIRQTSAGLGSQTFLTEYGYDEFRDFYLFGGRLLSYARPIAITIAPDYSLVLGLTPNSADYTITAEYFRAPHEMTDDEDAPIFPAQFHSAIVFKAMQKYGMYESASEVVQSAVEQFNQIFNKLVLAYAPAPCWGGSMI